MRCPKCQDEYEEGYTLCADCNIELIPDNQDSVINETSSASEHELKLPFFPVLKGSEFKVETENDYYIASHVNLPDICIIPFDNSYIFEIWQGLKSENIDYELFNKLNNEVMAVRILHNTNENMLVIDSCYQGEYSPDSFAAFFNLFLSESRKILENEDLKSLLV